MAADLVHQRIDSLLKLIGVRVSGLLHVEDLADVPHILYNVIQRLINGSTSQFSIDGNAKLLIGLDSADATLSEHQGTLAKDQIRLRGKDGLFGNRLLIAKAVQRCNFISNVTLQSIVIIEHADDCILEPQLNEQLGHGQLGGQHLFGGMIVGHIHSIAISVINLQGQGVRGLFGGDGALGNRRSNLGGGSNGRCHRRCSLTAASGQHDGCQCRGSNTQGFLFHKGSSFCGVLPRFCYRY